MEVDVLDKVKHLLTFESDDDFYYLQILQRKKENPHLGSNSRVIKNYYIGSVEYLEKHYEEIKSLCQMFNARAALRLNKRSYEKCAFKAIQNVANSIANREYGFIKKSYDRAVGDGHNDKNKKWIIDIDDGDAPPDMWLPQMRDYIKGCRPEGDKVIIILPTKNGWHLITSPFDLSAFRVAYPNLDIHKDNPINLYIP